MTHRRSYELRGTNVVEISVETAHSFGTSGYPLGLFVDGAGIIRFIVELPGTAFDGAYVEKLNTQTAGLHFKAPLNSARAK